MLLFHAKIAYCRAGVLREERCTVDLFATGFLWVLDWFIYEATCQPVDKEMILTVWRYDLEYSVLGSWDQRLHHGRVYQFQRHYVACAEHWEREAGRVHWPRGCVGRRTYSLVYVVSFGICVLGRSLSWGWRLWSGRLAGALELPNYLAVFLSWRTESKCQILLALPSAFKGSEARRWQFSL